jgi:hypothetical protein
MSTLLEERDPRRGNRTRHSGAPATGVSGGSRELLAADGALDGNQDASFRHALAASGRNESERAAPRRCSTAFVWLVADDWCWFVLREKYCWLVAHGWFVLREKYCWLVADKSNEQGVDFFN